MERIAAAVSLAARSRPAAVVAAAVLMGGMVESEMEIGFQIFTFTLGKIQRMA